MQELWTINRLSVELQKDRRALGRALEDLAPDAEKPISLTTPQQDEFFGEPVEETNDNHRVLKLWRLNRVIDHLFQPGAGLLNNSHERARLAKAQADRLEIENAVRTGELAELDVVEQEWADLVLAFRAKMLGLPTKMAPVLTNQKNPARIMTLLKTEIELALTELANEAGSTEITETPEPRSGDNVG